VTTFPENSTAHFAESVLMKTGITLQKLQVFLIHAEKHISIMLLQFIIILISDVTATADVRSLIINLVRGISITEEVVFKVFWNDSEDFLGNNFTTFS
jgi:hypothetical protein